MLGQWAIKLWSASDLPLHYYLVTSPIAIWDRLLHVNVLCSLCVAQGTSTDRHTRAYAAM